MIQELDLSSNDPLITHFKQLFETRTFEEDRHNIVKITHNPSWFSCRPVIVDKQLPIFIKQVKEMMKDFKSENDAFVRMDYGITNDTIHCKKGISTSDSEDDKINACVIYLDVECEGGELVFYKDNEPIKTIKPTSCKVVMFEGSVYHKRNDYSKGHRLAIVFQFTRSNSDRPPIDQVR